MKDNMLLLSRWVADPAGVGAIAPSGKRLAAVMAAAAIKAGPGTVVELGAGTGVVTRALLAAGVAPADLVVIERDPKFYRLLRHRFAGVQVVRADARYAGDVVKAVAQAPVRAVVCSLPLLTMPRIERHRVLKAATELLHGGGGVFVQFTYGRNAPISPRYAESLGMKMVTSENVWLNLPPAMVFVYESTMAGAAHHPMRSVA